MIKYKHIETYKPIKITIFKRGRKMKIKPKGTSYSKKKVIVGECYKCKRTVIFEKMYIVHNGSYVLKFCTECVHSIIECIHVNEEAKKESQDKKSI